MNISPPAVLGDLFRDEMLKFHQTKEKTPLYGALLDIFRVPQQFKRSGSSSNEPTPRNDMMCVLCTSVLGAYIEEIRNGATTEEISDLVEELCVGLNLQTERVCKGLIERNVNEFMYIINNRPNLTPEQTCGMIFQNLNCASDEAMADFDFTVNVDPNKPALSGSKDTSVMPSSSDLTIAHITDPHYDPAYQVGSYAACDETNCCRYDQPIPEGADASVGAGRWGDYRFCDSPLEAVIDAFTQIRRNHKVSRESMKSWVCWTNLTFSYLICQAIDYVYFTGDIVDHALWATTKEGIRSSVSRIHNLLDNIFTKVPIFPVIGNHESHPVNLFAPNSVPERFSTEWLYTFLADEWAQWLPESELATVRAGGYYTVLVRPGFRIITINNNDCYTFNWWLIYEPTFPRTQLQWLHDTLLAAETAGEKVHILAHVPPGDSTCFKAYSREYRRIVERFWNTISAQFAGHTHADEFNIFYSRENPHQALNVMWNGGSTTAFNDVNPNYRMLTMDQTTYQINHHETWIYNLTLANLTPNQNPTWFKEYEFLSEYGVSNLSPASLSNLAETFARDPSKMQRVSPEGKSVAGN